VLDFYKYVKPKARLNFMPTASSILRRELERAKTARPTGTKKCTSCRKTRPKSEFHKQQSTKDGLRYECKKCNKKKALKAYHANPAHYIKVQKAWQARNPDKVASYRA
jgi:hypothetical protein